MNKILKPVSHAACLLALIFVADVQAIIGVAPGGSVVRRHAIVATTTVAATSANANAAATANANAAAAKPPAAAPAAGATPAVGTTVTALPPGCVETDLNGVAYQHQRCGATYYKPSMMGSNLVFVVTQP